MRIALAAMGGTIAMVPGPDGSLIPAMDADTLLAAVPKLGEIPGLEQIETREICALGSPSIRLHHLLAAYHFAREQVANGACGVVITHGTDTLEESAYLFNLWWDQDAPVVFTGAMRSADEPGADGPANLFAAALLAVTPAAWGRGVLAVMNDEIFSAQQVHKADTFATDAFIASNGAPLGRIIEGQVDFRFQPLHRLPNVALPQRPARVAIVGTGIDDDGAHLAAIASQLDGLVVEGVGAGHVSAQCAMVLGEIAREIPVIVASRTGSGRTGTCSYGYPGAEVDLRSRSVLLSGYLTATQARILLLAVLSAAVPKELVPDVVEEYFR